MYNASMIVEPGDLSDVLSAEQQARLGRLLRQVVRLGHGEITIRVVRGEPKFIRMELEETFDRHVEGSRMAVMVR